MPVFKDFTAVGSTLLVFLFISNAYLTDDESNLRFDGSLYGSALYAPRVEETRTTAERPSPAMSRPPFASGKCLRCSPPMSGGVTSTIHDAGVPLVETGGHPGQQPSGNFTGL